MAGDPEIETPRLGSSGRHGVKETTKLVRRVRFRGQLSRGTPAGPSGMMELDAAAWDGRAAEGAFQASLSGNARHDDHGEHQENRRSE